MIVKLQAKAGTFPDDISITSLPFTIGSQEPPFLDFKRTSEQAKEAVSFLSHRHAQFLIKGEKLQLCDLGSKYGTELNGRTVGREPVPVHDGDSVSFSKFDYTVHLAEKRTEDIDNSSSLTLIPTEDKSGLDVINIDDCPFTISRNTGIFSTYLERWPEQIPKLSRRHAQITVEDGTYYVEDFGSRNGTWLSGARIGGAPVPLKNGDQLSFGSFCCYRVALHRPDGSDETEWEPAAGEMTVDDTVSEGSSARPSEIGDENEQSAGQGGADEAGSELASFAFSQQKAGQGVGKEGRIEQPGFRVDRPRRSTDSGSSSEPPSSQVDGSADESRFHALLSAGDSHVENGAYDAAAGEYQSALALKPNDRSVLDRLNSLEVILSEVRAASGKNAEEKSSDGYSTIDLSRPKSFIDVLLPDEKPDEAVEDTENDDSARPSGPPTPEASGKKLATRLSFFRELYRELHGGSTGSGRWKRFLYVIAAMGALIVVVGYLFFHNPERRVRKLMEEEQYEECLSSVSLLLQENPDDEALCSIATAALLRHYLPSWMSNLQSNKLNEAYANLAEMRKWGNLNPDGPKIVDLLEMIVDLEKFCSERVPGTSVAIYREEQLIRSIVERWERNKEYNQLLLQKILDSDASFESVRTSFFSNMNTMQSLDSEYLTAFADLDQSIRTKLSLGQPGEISGILDEFEDKYPHVGGVETVRSDLSNYLHLWKALAAEDYFLASRLLSEYPFLLDPFIENVDRLRKDRLPPQNIMSDFLAASTAWSSGKHEEAVSILEKMTEGRWARTATAKLERYRSILAGYRNLVESRNTSRYDSNLTAFYSNLVRGEDDHFFNLISRDLSRFKDQELNRALECYRKSKSSWDDYLRHGGISGRLRLEKTVSAEFRQMAIMLDTAMRNAATGNSAYSTFNQAVPKEWRNLYGDIIEEIESQRIRLNDLSRVMEPSVLESKLHLLPNPKKQK